MNYPIILKHNLTEFIKELKLHLSPRVHMGFLQKAITEGHVTNISITLQVFCVLPHEGYIIMVKHNIYRGMAGMADKERLKEEMNAVEENYKQILYAEGYTVLDGCIED